MKQLTHFIGIVMVSALYIIFSFSLNAACMNEKEETGLLNQPSKRILLKNDLPQNIAVYSWYTDECFNLSPNSIITHDDLLPTKFPLESASHIEKKLVMAHLPALEIHFLNACKYFFIIHTGVLEVEYKIKLAGTWIFKVRNQEIIYNGATNEYTYSYEVDRAERIESLVDNTKNNTFLIAMQHVKKNRKGKAIIEEQLSQERLPSRLYSTLSHSSSSEKLALIRPNSAPI